MKFMIFGLKFDFQSCFNYATEFAFKFRLVFASVFAIFISVQLYSSVNSILFPDIDFKASTVVNTSQQYVALNSDPFSSAKASAINQSIANSSESNKKGPETDLNIKLYGIVKSKEENVAIIGLPNEKQRSYKIGDKISGNLVVESIDDTFVNLRRNGKLESLSFAEVIKNKGFKQSIDPTKVASKDWLENLEIKELISFNPVIRDGEVLGIRVNPVKSSPFFQDDNLEPGDILTSFNGQKVTTVDLERELNQKVRNIEVGVIRDGSPITLTINLN
jgi:general secretion pathway protein C